MRELVLQEIERNWYEDEDYSTEEEAGMTLEEVKLLSDEDLLQLLMNMIAFQG